jgi:NAD(P)-dependent dehydrogenase (short-subunit alcohol dehydrogenase family)
LLYNMDQQKEHPKLAHEQPPFPAETQDYPGIEAYMKPRPDYGEQTYKGYGRLKDRVAIVTGGDSGIGRAVCLAFAREGAHVVCSYLNEEEIDAQETKRVVEAAGRKCVLMPGDIASDAQCKRIVDEAVSNFGKIDILVNNAAYQGKAKFNVEELDHDRVVRTFMVNIVPMFDLVRYALPHMKPGSSIINVGSIQAYNPSHYILDYATTKGAIVTFTKGLAQQLIERGIRVNCVAPGPVWTPIIVQCFPPEKVKDFGKNSPMGRPAMPSELAPPFVFLASDESMYVNGEVLGVTGGKPLG